MTADFKHSFFPSKEEKEIWDEAVTSNPQDLHTAREILLSKFPPFLRTLCEKSYPTKVRTHLFTFSDKNKIIPPRRASPFEPQFGKRDEIGPNIVFSPTQEDLQKQKEREDSNLKHIKFFRDFSHSLYLPEWKVDVRTMPEETCGPPAITIVQAMVDNKWKEYSRSVVVLKEGKSNFSIPDHIINHYENEQTVLVAIDLSEKRTTIHDEIDRLYDAWHERKGILKKAGPKSTAISLNSSDLFLFCYFVDGPYLHLEELAKIRGKKNALELENKKKFIDSVRPVFTALRTFVDPNDCGKDWKPPKISR